MLNKNNADEIAQAVENAVYSSYSALGKIVPIPIDTPFIVNGTTITDPEIKINKSKSFLLLAVGGIGLVLHYHQDAIKITFLYYSGRILHLIMRLSIKNHTLFNACGHYLYRVLKEVRKMKGERR